MAPESLKEKIYSKKSDVWMFGIVGLYFVDYIEIDCILSFIDERIDSLIDLI
jgi:hypothetical protein